MSALSSTSSMLAARPESSAYVVTMQPIATATPDAADEDRPSIAGRIVRSVIGVGVGAAVGGWLGYFGAQVTNSDWTHISDHEKTSLRQSYTRVGVGVGALTGYFLRPKAHAPSRLPQPWNVPARSGRLLLASGELRRSIATNALEAIEMGRPEWIQQQRRTRQRTEVRRRTAPSSRPHSSSTSATRRWARSRRCATSPSPRSRSFASTIPATRAVAGAGITSTARSKSCRRMPSAESRAGGQDVAVPVVTIRRRR